jgi:3-oxoacyl-[acyl-carrier protein] reductase
LITGSSRGIGAAIATTAASQGGRVLINYLSRRDCAVEVAQAVEVAGGEAFVIQGDVRQQEDALRLVDASNERWGGLDWLINNAHTPYRHLPADQLEWHDYDEQIAGTLQAAVNMTQAAMPLLLQSSIASILNISSITVQRPMAGLAARSAAKAALEGYTRSIACEYSGRIRVNAIAVGWTRTDQFDGLSDGALAEALAGIPAGRFALPEEIAQAALFLLSNRASFISGLVLPVVGGLGSAGGV